MSNRGNSRGNSRGNYRVTPGVVLGGGQAKVDGDAVLVGSRTWFVSEHESRVSWLHQPPCCHINHSNSARDAISHSLFLSFSFTLSFTRHPSTRNFSISPFLFTLHTRYVRYDATRHECVSAGVYTTYIGPGPVEMFLFSSAVNFPVSLTKGPFLFLLGSHIQDTCCVLY